MAKLKYGDYIECKIKDAVIVSAYAEYDSTKTFEILATDGWGYYIYIPNYFFIQKSLKVDRSFCAKYSIDFKYINEKYIHIAESCVYQITFISDGKACERCRQFTPMAAGNQEDGSFLCFICRTSPY